MQGHGALISINVPTLIVEPGHTTWYSMQMEGNSMGESGYKHQ
jgi:hypothetical protein